MSMAAATSPGDSGSMNKCSEEGVPSSRNTPRIGFANRCACVKKASTASPASLLSSQQDAEDAMQEALCTAYEKALYPQGRGKISLLAFENRGQFRLRYFAAAGAHRSPGGSGARCRRSHRGQAGALDGGAAAAGGLPHGGGSLLLRGSRCNARSVKSPAIPEATVKTRLFRARQRLKSLLAE